MAIAGAALLAAFGCGGSDAGVSSGKDRDKTVVPAAETDSATPGLQTVTYQGLQFDVPAGWPVHDLAADPSTCVRFDVNAVYLGTPGADMSCPAGIVGRADAVLVQPTDPSTTSSTTPPTDVSATTASGLALRVGNDGVGSRKITADLPTVGISVTASYQDSDATAQQILQSFRSAS